MITTLTALALSMGPAEAASLDQVSLGVSTLGSRDENFDLISSNGLNSFSGRATVGLSDHLGVIASFDRSNEGGTIVFEEYGSQDYDSEGYDDYNTSELAIAFAGNQLKLGPKYGHAVTSWLVPYATAQASLMQGRLLLDDDREDEDNINQLRYRAWSPGVVAAAGVDVLILGAQRKVRPGTHLEMGYGHQLSLNFKDANGEQADENKAIVGDLDFSGFYLSWGLGLYF